MQFSDHIPHIFKQYTKPANLVELSSCLLIILWVYASLSKLIDYEHSRGEMLNQVFSKQLAAVLVWLIPIIELLVSCLLISIKTRLLGLYASILLLVIFTVYIGLVMTNIFGRIPCSCGGFISKMTWGEHLLFNLFFLVLTLAGVFYHLKERRTYGEGQ
ncbi:MAG: MauE/DoxX family redox-associated membrane protein [Daejeonella sp.]